MIVETRNNPLPSEVLSSAEIREACSRRDVGAIFRIARTRAGLTHTRLAILCEMTPSRVGSYAKGTTSAREVQVIERVADGLRIPGPMLGLASRPWESADSAEWV